MKIDSIPSKASMDAERKRMEQAPGVSSSIQDDTVQAKLTGNASSSQSEISTEVNMDIDLTFEKDKWTPCG